MDVKLRSKRHAKRSRSSLGEAKTPESEARASLDADLALLKHLTARVPKIIPFILEATKPGDWFVFTLGETEDEAKARMSDPAVSRFCAAYASEVRLEKLSINMHVTGDTESERPPPPTFDLGDCKTELDKDDTKCFEWVECKREFMEWDQRHAMTWWEIKAYCVVARRV